MKRTIWNDSMTLETLDWRRKQLNVKLDIDVVVIADLGLWNGRRSGYKVYHNPNLSQLLTSCCDWCDWYLDSHDFRCDATHHDGTNHLLYRVFRKGLSETQKQNFLNKIYFGKVTSNDITKYTKSLKPFVAPLVGLR